LPYPTLFRSVRDRRKTLSGPCAWTREAAWTSACSPSCAAIGTLIAAKVNQWSLLVGSLPIAHLLGGGGTGLPLDGRQVEDFTLTATQSLLGVALIIGLRFHWAAALGLAGLFGLQFIVTDTSGRYVLCAIQAGLALVFLLIHSRDIVPTLRAPFARTVPTPAGDA